MGSVFTQFFMAFFAEKMDLLDFTESGALFHITLLSLMNEA